MIEFRSAHLARPLSRLVRRRDDLQLHTHTHRLGVVARHSESDPRRDVTAQVADTNGDAGKAVFREEKLVTRS